MAAEPSSRTKLVQVTAAEGGRYPLPDGPALDAYSRVVTEVARTLAPSVANLRVRQRRALGGGSAFVIAPDGYLVTSAHVVEGGATGRASFTDGRESRFSVVGADPLSDLALLRHGRVRRAYLGIAGGSRPLPPRVAARLGRNRAIEVVEVVPGSPAERAGLRPEDLIVGLDGAALGDVGELQRRMTEEAIGRELRLEVVRGGEARGVVVVPTELSD